MLDDRAKLLLKALVERYIADGQPVGSRTLSKASGLELSPATIRNVMSDLEELGLIASPHTSAGRIPTNRGYRLFVDTMLTVQKGELLTQRLAPDQPQKVIANAANMLSSLSHYVGVVMAPKRASVFRHIEFLRLSEKRVLLIIVSPEGDVQNRVIFTEADYSQSQLIEASNYLNAHYVGMAIEQVRLRVKQELVNLQSEIASLMQAAVQMSSEALSEDEGDVVIQASAICCRYPIFPATWANCAVLSSCLKKKRNSCVCSIFLLKPKVCEFTLAVKAKLFLLRNCQWSAPITKLTDKWWVP